MHGEILKLMVLLLRWDGFSWVCCFSCGFSWVCCLHAKDWWGEWVAERVWVVEVVDLMFGWTWRLDELWVGGLDWTRSDLE